MEKLVLSFNDSCLYDTDISIIKSENGWLSDRIISFYFEYLHARVFCNERILFIGPEVAQTIKLMANPEECNSIILNPLNVQNRDFIILAINDNFSNVAGGTHWSLCVYSKPENSFFHFDSSDGFNRSACMKIVNIMKTCLSCKTADVSQVQCLQQDNSYDCGIHVLCHTDLICQTIGKGESLHAVEKLQTEKVHRKRRKVFEIIKELEPKIS